MYGVVIEGFYNVRFGSDTIGGAGDNTPSNNRLN